VRAISRIASARPFSIPIFSPLSKPLPYPFSIPYTVEFILSGFLIAFTFKNVENFTLFIQKDFNKAFQDVKILFVSQKALYRKVKTDEKIFFHDTKTFAAKVGFFYYKSKLKIILHLNPPAQ
jgi:hypothetical protein